MPNRLIDETSPYLLQHAHNPVDWYPWGAEALEHAKNEDRPILLSVGYSACHWCHVMERESFENPSIAALMNEHFVSIKVDREERPDIDSIYMAAVQALTGHGGWPMTVFLTPEGKPFYGGTYFPPEDRGGMPAFPRVLVAIAEAYRERRGEVVNTTNQLVLHMRQATQGTQGVDPLTTDVMTRALVELEKQFDDTYGGFGLEPKFPQPMTYEFLLRAYLRTEDPQVLEMVELTLEHMARGGIYDQLGGGFHRYSTDTYWLVPHFEKMLYDNALLVRLYLHAYQVTGKALYRQIVEETLDYVAREMTSAEGGFYSAQDADSEGEEGKFFVWRPEEIIDVLGEENGAVVNEFYGVTVVGNFEGKSILHIPTPLSEFAGKSGIAESQLMEILARSGTKLLERRSRRIAPGLDDKVLTAWNGLMLAAFAEASVVLRRDDYREIAIANGTFLLDNLIDSSGRLLRTYKDGRAKLNGYLEDYAFLIDGLLLLHEATFGEKWLTSAISLGSRMVDLFWDEGEKQFFDTGVDHENLVIRPRDVTDNALPSGSSMATSVLLKLSVLTGDSSHNSRAASALRSTREMMQRFPSAAGHWLGTLEFYLAKTKEIVIIGESTDLGAVTLVDQVYEEFLPNRVFVGASESIDSDLPLLQDRRMIGGRPTAYVCENYVCQLPVNDATALANQLAG